MRKKPPSTGRAMPPSGGITPEVLLDHMRGMEHRVMHVMDERFASVNVRLDRMDGRLERMDGNIGWLAVARDNLNERLDDIEMMQIPKLRKSVRMLSTRR